MVGPAACAYAAWTPDTPVARVGGSLRRRLAWAFFLVAPTYGDSKSSISRRWIEATGEGLAEQMNHRLNTATCPCCWTGRASAITCW